MATLLQRLALLITGDDKGAVSALERTALAEEKLAVAEAKRLVAQDKLAVAQAKQAVVEAKAAGEAEALSAATEQLAAAQARLAETTAAANVTQAQAAYAQSERAVAGFAQQAQNAAVQTSQLSALTGASATSIAAAAVAGEIALERMSNKFSEATETVRKFRDISGASTEESSRFVNTFNRLGVDVDTADSAVAKLEKTLGKNNDALAAWGVTVIRNKDGSENFAATLAEISDKYNSLGSQEDKAAFASAAFGKGYASIIPVLRAGSDAVKELGNQGPVFHDDDIRKGEDFAIAMRRVKEAVVEVEEEVGKNAVQDFADLANMVASSLKPFALLLDLIARLKDKLGEDFIGPLIRKIPGATALAEKFANAMHLTSSAADRLARSASTAGAGVDDLTDPTANATDALTGLVGAVQSYRSAVEKADTTAKAAKDTRAAFAQKAADEAKATADAAKATSDLEQAQDALNKARRDAPLELAKARDAEALATDDVADKTRAAADAIDHYGATSIEAKKAQDELNKSKDDATEAQRKADDLAKAGDRPDAVVQAEQQVAAAKERQAAAAQDKAKADKEDPVAINAQNEQAAKDAVLDREIAHKNLVKSVDDFNKAFGQTLSVEDLVQGKADKLLKTLLDAATQAAQLTGAGLTPGQDAANKAAVLQGPLTNPRLIPGNRQTAASSGGGGVTISNVFHIAGMTFKDVEALAEEIEKRQQRKVIQSLARVG